MGYFLISRVFDFNKKDVRGRGVRALMPFCQVRVRPDKTPEYQGKCTNHLWQLSWLQRCYSHFIDEFLFWLNNRSSGPITLLLLKGKDRGPDECGIRVEKYQYFQKVIYWLWGSVIAGGYRLRLKCDAL